MQHPPLHLVQVRMLTSKPPSRQILTLKSHMTIVPKRCRDGDDGRPESRAAFFSNYGVRLQSHFVLCLRELASRTGMALGRYSRTHSQFESENSSGAFVWAFQSVGNADGHGQNCLRSQREGRATSERSKGASIGCMVSNKASPDKIQRLRLAGMVVPAMSKSIMDLAVTRTDVQCV